MGGQRRTGDRNVDEIEYIFRHEREIREAVLEAKLGTVGRTGGNATGHSYVSDPTPAAALRRVEEVGCVTLGDKNKVFKPERWLEVVGAVREWCAKDALKAEIFRRRYEKKESYVLTCGAIHIVQQTYSLLLWDIRNFALQCACQTQLVKVF